MKKEKFLNYSNFFINESIANVKRPFDVSYFNGMMAWIDKLEPSDIAFLLMYGWYHEIPLVHASDTSGFDLDAEINTAVVDATITLRKATNMPNSIAIEDYSAYITGKLGYYVITGKRGSYMDSPEDDEFILDNVEGEIESIFSKGEEIKIKNVSPLMGYDLDELNEMSKTIICELASTSDVNVKIKPFTKEIPYQLLNRTRLLLQEDDILEKLIDMVNDKKVSITFLENMISDDKLKKYQTKLGLGKLGF